MDESEIIIAIQEDLSGILVSYDVLAVGQSPWHTARDHFHHHAAGVIPGMTKGEARKYRIFVKAAGQRPRVMKATLYNRPLVVERSVTGSRWPGRKEVFPYDDSEMGKPEISRKGSFPAPPGTGRFFVEDDDGVDDAAVTAALRECHRFLKVALDEKFEVVTRLALREGLTALMQSTGAPGLAPREDGDLDSRVEESALLFFDVALALWIKAGHEAELDKSILSGHVDRLERDMDHYRNVELLIRSMESGRL